MNRLPIIISPMSEIISLLVYKFHSILLYSHKFFWVNSKITHLTKLLISIYWLNDKAVFLLRKNTLDAFTKSSICLRTHRMTKFV